MIWNVNPFDQWGVELGKTLQREHEPRDPRVVESSTGAMYGRRKAKQSIASPHPTRWHATIRRHAPRSK